VSEVQNQSCQVRDGECWALSGDKLIEAVDNNRKRIDGAVLQQLRSKSIEDIQDKGSGAILKRELADTINRLMPSALCYDA
jgi:flagellar basal body-associated protein FliL